MENLHLKLADRWYCTYYEPIHESYCTDTLVLVSNKTGTFSEDWGATSGESYIEWDADENIISIRKSCGSPVYYGEYELRENVEQTTGAGGKFTCSELYLGDDWVFVNTQALMLEHGMKGELYSEDT